MKARLHVLQWRFDRAADEDEEPTALLHGVLELDGQMVQNGKVKIETGGDEIVMLTAELIVTSLEVVEHSDESWKELDLP